MSVQSTTTLNEVSPIPVRDKAGKSQRKSIPTWLIPTIVSSAIVVGRILVWFACRLSWRGARALSSWVTMRVEPLTRSCRQANQRLFFLSSPRTEDQLHRSDKEHMDYLARMRAEVARCFKKTPEWLKENVQLEGENHLRAVLSRGRGALLVSGHTATWWFAPGILAVKGYAVTAVFTPIHFPQLERLLVALAKRFEVRIAFVGRDAYKAARHAIEHNEILYLTFDVAVRPRRAQYFPFGGGQLQIDPGPAVMAVRNDLPVLQAACVHLDNERHLISIYDPGASELNPQTANADDLCRLWTQRLEKEVQLHPEQWWPWGYVQLLKGDSTLR